MPLVPIEPPEIAQPAANYAHAVMAIDASRILHTAGVVPVRTDGTVPEDITEQAEVIWTNIEAILKNASMKTSDVVSVTTYMVAKTTHDKVSKLDFEKIMKVRDSAMGEHIAASTLLVVAQLAQPAWKIEIAIVAVN